MERIIKEEFQEIFKLLDEQGWEPKICDTPVPYFDSGVQAGIPTDHGDFTRGEMMMIPEELLKNNLTFIIDVKGDSMKDADIMPGDRVQLQIGKTVRDGDIIIASINDEYTLKAYCEDELGNKWLVPRNDAYMPILLTKDMKLDILGKVTCVMKDSPRMPYAELLKRVKAVRDEVAPDKKEITIERVEQVIREMGDMIKQVRQWYAVFRPMVDAGVLAEDDYNHFVYKVSSLLPMHDHLPVAPELRRMAVDSFRKKVDDWKRDDAPVSGYRFEAYMRIARFTAEKLNK